MKMFVGAAILALTTSALPALAQNNPGANSPNVTVPSGQNSGAGIQGYKGNKNGPGVHPGTVGSATGNSGVRQQDPAKIQGMPGNKSGPAAKPR